MKRIHVGAGVVALVLAVAMPAVAIADVGLPPAGSTAPSDDVVVPTIAPGSSVFDVVTWLQAALGARTTEVNQLLTEVSASTSPPSRVRTLLTAIIHRTNDSLSLIGSRVPGDTTLQLARVDVGAVVGLHVFSVLQPKISEVLAVESTKTAIRQLLAQEVSIRAAVAASKSAHVPVAKANALLLRFHTDLTTAKALVDPMTSLVLGSSSVATSTTNVATAVAAVSAAGALIAQAKVIEQSIVTSLSAKVTVRRI